MAELVYGVRYLDESCRPRRTYIPLTASNLIAHNIMNPRLGTFKAITNGRPLE